jgi:hypothetical protein
VKIAGWILLAPRRPPHVNLREILIKALEQSSEVRIVPHT